MIKYEWRTALSTTESAELADLLRRAAAYDAEPEYSTIDFGDVEQEMSRTHSSVKHLVIWMLPYATAMGQPDEPDRVAGLLRLNFVSTDTAEATAIIDPDLRSIGIMTLLLEQVGVETAQTDGWMSCGAHTISALARGNHPAADRLSSRFSIPRTRRTWKLIRSSDPAEATSTITAEPVEASALGDFGWASALADEMGVHVVRNRGSLVGLVALDLRATRSEGFGRCATMRRAIIAPESSAGSLEQLLEGAAAATRAADLSGLTIYIDSDDAEMVKASRLAAFQHDRTDARFQLGGDA